MLSTAYIALGSNQGDRELNLLLGIAELGKQKGLRVTAVSPFYETEPVGPVPQDNFYNAALRVETEMSPHELLTTLQQIETSTFGRSRDVRWGPRRLDLDILFYDNLVLAADDLTLPHPRLHQRRFVLVPLADIAPGLVHPVLGTAVADLLRDCSSGEHVLPLEGN